MILSRRLRLLSIGWLVALAGPLAAQSVPTGPRSNADPADTVRSPITPKKAFLLSLAAPGAAQNILGRNRAGAALIAVEAISIGMIRESAADLAQARRQLGDSLVGSFVDGNGDLLPKPTLTRRRFGDEEVRSRRSHVEDWIALLIANHLFAGADAFVAASLWDVDAHIAVRRDGGRVLLMARVGW